MSDIILPESATPGFVQGRKLKRYVEVMGHVGWILCLRRMEQAKGARCFKENGMVGIIFSAFPMPHYPVRLGALLVIESAPPAPPNPINVAILDAKLLEACDPWVFAPGFPEKSVSLLQS